MIGRNILKAGLVLAFAAPAAVDAQVTILHEDPWGQGYTIDNAANDVFGLGNWTYGNFGASAASVFSGANSFVYLEGGNGTQPNWQNYISTNQALIEGWVNGGGRLLLNSATWYGNASLIFGLGLQNGGSSSAYAANALHPLFSDLGYGDPGTSWTGSSFNHDYVTGAGVSAIILDGNNNAALSEGIFGAGYLMVGSLTTDNFRYPSPQAQYLTRNVLHYASNCTPETCVGDPGTVTPEPVTMTLLGTGLAGVAAARRRRKAAQTV